MAEGGEQKQGTNINALLEQFKIIVNPDSVVRRTFCKYLHPKEAYVANGILNQELVRSVLHEFQIIHHKIIHF